MRRHRRPGIHRPGVFQVVASEMRHTGVWILILVCGFVSHGPWKMPGVEVCRRARHRCGRGYLSHILELGGGIGRPAKKRVVWDAIARVRQQRLEMRWVREGWMLQLMLWRLLLRLLLVWRALGLLLIGKGTPIAHHLGSVPGLESLG